MKTRARITGHVWVAMAAGMVLCGGGAALAQAVNHGPGSPVAQPSPASPIAAADQREKTVHRHGPGGDEARHVRASRPHAHRQHASPHHASHHASPHHAGRQHPGRGVPSAMGAPVRHLHRPTAQPHTSGDAHGHDEALTEFLFAYTVGTDIAPAHHRHLLVDTSGGFGKGSGTYGAVGQRIELGFVPWENFHVGLGASMAYHAISGVDGLEAAAPRGTLAPDEAVAMPLRRGQAEFDGLSLEFRQRLLERERAPFGLTVVVEPHWGRVEEVSGALVTKHAVGFLVAVDKDIVPNTLFTALNVFYEPEWVRLRDTGESERESTFGVSGAAMLRLSPTVFAGADARWLRKYEGAAMQTLAGEAVFVGPAIYASVGGVLISAAYGVQVWGRVPGVDESLDLDHFTRHQAKLRVVAHF
ncbi:hypothetical protein [Rhodoplanes serenus]|uniref:hypothetical protein n=1 Tax=Rhodoplanes serenus TaxID=200615 RepID=UPI0011B94B8B|nr:hypothetical protein [Rhodoplanes serenus]